MIVPTTSLRRPASESHIHPVPPFDPSVVIGVVEDEVTLGWEMVQIALWNKVPMIAVLRRDDLLAIIGNPNADGSADDFAPIPTE